MVASFIWWASRSDNFKANYFQPEKSTWLDIVESLQCDPRVFIAMVFYFKMLFYHDGGISDAIPVKEAYRRGCRTIVVYTNDYRPDINIPPSGWIKWGKWFENGRFSTLSQYGSSP